MSDISLRGPISSMTSLEGRMPHIISFIFVLLRFLSEKEPSIVQFDFLGVVKDYNEVDIKQSSHYIEMSCPNYIHRLCKSLGRNWNNSLHKDEMAFAINSLFDIHSLQNPEGSHKKDGLPNSYMEYESKRIVPMPSNCYKRMYQETGSKEMKMGFSYLTLLGEVKIKNIPTHIYRNGFLHQAHKFNR